MYIPAHFAPDASAVQDLLTRADTADLVTATANGLIATYLPILYDAGSGPHGSVLAHVARNNDQWCTPVLGEAMAIVHGPDAYVSPSWYASKAEHGRVVPTWNYVTAHLYGELVVHDDPQWLVGLVRRLTDRHEAGREHPWSVDDAPERYVAGQLRAIVGVELRITRVEAKFKLSQNRPAADIDGVIAGQTAAGATAAADAARAARP
ncbi:FMN-binding negative transcriptional regulator [Winogradskya humida]|uniref:Transcriptional regulator n=1 Tax=Winogradskya humida TaxID=113566 RepID=A0ABQ3ZUR9_9ACTN|nr:FMN-binding negative transcriptional regulator [Actinoplanes humidus]GIE22272.1 transcriptional regulator [Actinoplanes humidus]